MRSQWVLVVRFDQDQLLHICQQFIFHTAKQLKSELAKSELVAAFQLCCHLACFNHTALKARGSELAEVAATLPSIKPRSGYASVVVPSVLEQWILLLSALIRVLRAVPEHSVKQRHVLSSLLAIDGSSDELYRLMLQAARERYGPATAAMTVDEGYEEDFFVGDPRTKIDYSWVNRAYRDGREVVFLAGKSKPPTNKIAAMPIKSIALPGPHKPSR